MMNTLSTDSSLCCSVQQKAALLAERLPIPVVVDHDLLSTYPICLFLDAEGLSLCADGMSLCADLTRMIPRLKKNNLASELLVKASRIRNPEEPLRAVDATAGFGEDALLLAAAGFEVQLFEFDPVIAALLQDALDRAAKIPELAEAVSRMKLTEGDSTVLLPQLSYTPDVILLDPMFPARQKSSLVQKKFQLLHHLEQPCSDEEALVHAAIAANPHKVIIKRPLKGPYLAGIKPSFSQSGKAIRYDCLVLPSLRS